MKKTIKKVKVSIATKEEQEQAKNNEPLYEGTFTVTFCKHQNQGEGKCFDCGVPISN